MLPSNLLSSSNAHACSQSQTPFSARQAALRQATSSQSKPLPEKIEPFIHDYTRTLFISTLNPSRLTASDHQSLSRKPYVTLCPRMLQLHARPLELSPQSNHDASVNLQREI